MSPPRYDRTPPSETQPLRSAQSERGWVPAEGRSDGSQSHALGRHDAPPVDRHARSLIARIRKNWNDVEAIRSLAQHYTRAADYLSLANLMEGWAHSLQEPRAAADAFVEAADALLLSGQGVAEARVLYERALSRDASQVQALDRLTRLLEEAGDHERLKQVLKYVAYRLEQEAGSRQLLASVHYRLGHVYEQHFSEPRKAASLYRRAIDENPRLITAISAARRLYLESGNHKTVSVLYEFEIEASAVAEDKHMLLLALGRHKRELCDDLDGAILAFRRANKLAPNSTRALFSLAEALLARSERAEPLASAADRQRAAEVFFHLARNVNSSDALPYLQRALLIVPEHAGARALLDLLTRGPRSPDAAPHAVREPARPRATTPTAPAAPATWSAPAPAPSPSASGDGAAAADWLGNEALESVPSTLERLERDELGRAADATPTEPHALPLPLSTEEEGRVPSVPPAALQQPLSQRAPLRSPPPPPPPSKIVSTLSHDPTRIGLEVNVGSTTDSNFYVDLSDHLIDGGVYVATYEALPVGTATSLTITLPGRTIARAHGRVTLIRDLMDAFDDHIPGMCVAFEAVDAHSLALMERFARKRAPMLIEP